jgi:hypothetical protein
MVVAPGIGLVLLRGSQRDVVFLGYKLQKESYIKREAKKNLSFSQSQTLHRRIVSRSVAEFIDPLRELQ